MVILQLELGCRCGRGRKGHCFPGKQPKQRPWGSCEEAQKGRGTRPSGLQMQHVILSCSVGSDRPHNEGGDYITEELAQLGLLPTDGEHFPHGNWHFGSPTIGRSVYALLVKATPFLTKMRYTEA